MSSLGLKNLKKHFRHLALAREDVREELEWLGMPAGLLVGDFGCGSGLLTFALACEISGSQCVGIDRTAVARRAENPTS